MSMITLSALGVTLGHRLFSDLSFTLSKGDRVGVVAANGTGKSTLFACIAGDLDPTTGDITRARSARVGYVRQDLPQSLGTTSLYDLVLGALPPEQANFENWRVDVLLDALHVPTALHHEPLCTLSGGWQRTAMLAAAWITDPDILLLDEPTNHLDLGRIGLLETWLAALPRTVPVMTISHDRAFLDATTNRTLFLRPTASRHFPLSYSAARAALEEADAADARHRANALNKAQTLRKQAAKLKNVGVNSGSDLLLTKTKHLTARAEKIEAAVVPAQQEHRAGDIRLANRGTHAKALITLDDVRVTTPAGQPLYSTGVKWITKGDRVGLLGANGAGKTQLVTLIQAALQGNGGPVKCAPSVVPAYSDQHLSQLDAATSPMEAITRAFDIGDHRARAALAGAGISKRMQDGPIAALSGGQRARLAMLILRLHNPNFYLLDEPTNHLDIDGQEALEHELITHETSCLFVSHDRSFLRNVGNRFWWIKGKRLEEVADAEAFLATQMALP